MNATGAIPAILSLLGMWVWLAWVYRAYRIDLYRERLFAIRDDLFDLGRAGLVPFDNPAYGILRTQINGFIRFGDRVSVAWVIGLAMASRGIPADDKRSVMEPVNMGWAAGLARLDDSAKAQVEAIQKRVHDEFASQLLFASPLVLLVFVVTVVPIATSILLATQVKRLFLAPWQAIADIAAYSEGKAALQQGMGLATV